MEKILTTNTKINVNNYNYDWDDTIQKNTLLNSYLGINNTTNSKENMNSYQSSSDISVTNSNELNYNSNNSDKEIINKKIIINIDILFILESKYIRILNKINSSEECSNEIIDFIKYYFESKLFLEYIKIYDKENKKNILHIIKYELIFLFLCYDISFNKNFNKASLVFKRVLNKIHLHILLFINYILNNDLTLIKFNNEKLIEILKAITIKYCPVLYNKEFYSEQKTMIKFIKNNFIELRSFLSLIIDTYYIKFKDNVNVQDFLTNYLKIKNDHNNFYPNRQKIISIFFHNIKDIIKNESVNELIDFFKCYLSREEDQIATINLLSKTKNFFLPLRHVKYKYTLIIEIDKILVYTDTKSILYNSTSNIKQNQYIIRENLNEFLNTLKDYNYELIGITQYNDNILNNIIETIDPKKKIFDFIFSNTGLIYNDDDNIYSIANFLNRDINSLIFLTYNNQITKSALLNNTIFIQPFFKDNEYTKQILIKLTDLLIKIYDNNIPIKEKLKKYWNYILLNISTNNINIF